MIAAAVVVVVALVAVGLATVFDSSDQPSHWDARLGDLPATVARLRGLHFTHPVPVRYESDADFKRTLGPSKPSASARRAAARATESLRAVGLVAGKVDLFDAAKTSRDNRVLAFYDPDTKVVVIRGGTAHLDAAHRVVLAHELTHVLQDQNFDLNALEAAVRKAPGQSPDALRAVVEGDATRIEDAYASRLSAHDRAEYRAWQRKGGQAADQATADVPAVLTVLQSAPYALGAPALQVVTSDGGNAAVDRVFRHGVFTQEYFVEPAGSLTQRAPKPLRAPKAARGEKTVGSADELGAFDLYLLLASRIDPGDALGAATAWAGGGMRTVRTHGRTCVRGSVASTTPTAARSLERDLGEWSGALPAGMATLHRRGRIVTLRSCDPGTGVALASPDAAIRRAQSLLVAHAEIELGLVKSSSDVRLDVARCAALAFVRSPQLSAVLSLPEDQITEKMVRDATEAAAPDVRDACVT